MPSSALVILSGGQDSTTCLFWAKTRFDKVHAVTFDYNQRHSLEIAAAQKVAELAGVESHEIIKLGPILKGRSFLTDDSEPIEVFENFDQMSRKNIAKEDKLDSSFVPMRNALFLTIAANRAYVHDCNLIITGVTAADFAEYGELSWDWLGGFVDAEGHFSSVNDKGWRLTISQNDPELLYRIQNWLENQIENFESSIHIRPDGIQSDLYIGKLAATEIMPFLSPHLHSLHRRNQAKQLGVKLYPEISLSDAYVTGFWEGDGSCWSDMAPTRQARKNGSGKMTASFKFLFFQKHPQLLEVIQNYLNCGYLYQRNTQNKIWVLDVSDGPHSAKFLRRMQPHMNVLRSFEKIAIYRHKVNLAAGGFNPPYPDCTPDFIWSMQQAIDEALHTPFVKKIKIETPVMYLTKAQSINMALSLPGCMEALAYSHTSYDGLYPPTGKNHANLLRAKGFEIANVPDPLVVRAWQEGLMDLPKTPNYNGVNSPKTAI